MPNPYFAFKQFMVLQEKGSMKITTDSCLLGACARAHNPHRILDIGTGTGIIALMLAQRFPDAQIDAVEIEEEACQQAWVNFKNSPWADRLHLFCLPIQNFESDHPNPYDLITSNPPYFSRHKLSGSRQGKNIARHDLKLTLEDLSHMVSKNLSDSGVFYIVLPTKESGIMKNFMWKNFYSFTEVINISSITGQAASKNITGYSKKSKECITKQLDIYDHSHQYTREYKKLLKDFYLGF